MQRLRIGSGLGCLARGRLDVVLLRPGRTQLVDSFFEGGRFGDGCAALLRLCRTQPVGGDLGSSEVIKRQSWLISAVHVPVQRVDQLGHERRVRMGPIGRAPLV